MYAFIGAHLNLNRTDVASFSLVSVIAFPSALVSVISFFQNL